MADTDSEFVKRLMASERVAGPDDPIYSSGLTMTSVQKPKQSMPPSQPYVPSSDEEKLEAFELLGDLSDGLKQDSAQDDPQKATTQRSQTTGRPQYDPTREYVKEMYPGLSESDLDELMM
jgi:hypothetical protein